MSGRKDALRTLAESHGMDPHDRSNSGNEDLGEYLDVENYEPYDIREWCAVTISGEGEFHYAYPDYDTAEDAQARCLEYVTDDIFSEAPVAVVNLDTGETRVPDWSSLAWKVSS